MDGLVSASGSSEDMALVKKLNALEVENKQLKKGKSFNKKSREGVKNMCPFRRCNFLAVNRIS